MKSWLRRLVCCHSMAPQWPLFGMRRARRFFEKGVLRFAVLDLIAQKPAHGYEIIRALEERSRGLYAPSPGSIYPILQQLQNQGYVTSTERDGKKVYTITKTGRSYLSENADITRGLKQAIETRRNRAWLREEFQDTAEEIKRAANLLLRRAPHLSREQIGQVHDAVHRMVREVEDIIRP